MSTLIWLPWMTREDGIRSPGGDRMKDFVLAGGGWEIVNADGSGDDGRRALVRMWRASGAERTEIVPADREPLTRVGGADRREECAEGVTVAEHRAGVGPRGGR